jgi:hypothetical protein
MKKTNRIILSASLAMASLVSVARAGLLVQTEPDVSKNAFVGESQRFAFPRTDFDKTNGIPETYQWIELDPVFGFSTPIPDATNRVYEIASVQPTDATYRLVRVSDGTTTEFSAFIALTVKQDGVLIVNTWSPDSVYLTLIHQGQPFELTVPLTDFGKSEKDANNLTFQWYRVDGFGNQTAIPGATSRTYSVASAQISDVSFYTVSVSNGTTTEQPPELYEVELEVP